MLSLWSWHRMDRRCPKKGARNEQEDDQAVILDVVLGDLVGGRNDRTEKILGAGIGAVAGAGVGYYMDQQEKKLRERTAGTGIDVERQGDQLVLNMPGDVTFDLNSAVVKSQFRGALDSVASTLSEYPSTYIDVYGHTDSQGSETYNQGLSERRAASVADYLAGRGVNRARMATMGYGETQLKCAPERTQADYQCNRRVEIRIAPVTQADVGQANGVVHVIDAVLLPKM